MSFVQHLTAILPGRQRASHPPIPSSRRRVYIGTTISMQRISAESFFRFIFALAIVAAPLPFGLVEPVWTFTAAALICVLCAAALASSAIRGEVLQDRNLRLTIVISALLVVGTVAILQRIPLPGRLVEILSPESAAIWRRASAIATLQGMPPLPARVSVDLDATDVAIAHFAAIGAAFVTSALLFRTRSHHALLAAVVIAAATLQSLFAFAQFIDPDPVNTIWGWRNRQIVNRVSGTFVNPNHFGHHVSLAIPMAGYLLLHFWKRHRDSRDVVERMRRFLEKDLFFFSLVALAGLAITAALLLSKSRGALLSLGVAAAGAMALHSVTRGRKGRRRRRGATRWLVPLALAGALVAASSLLIDRLRGEQFDRIFSAEDRSVTLRGRLEGIEVSLAILQRFPLLGSGLGTFDSLAMVSGDRGAILGHAHNDYLEILATGGAPLFAALLVLLLLFWRSLHRDLKAHDPNGSRDQRRFMIAAAAVLLFVQIHALFDFNFFILANPITAAAILGATAAMSRVSSTEA